MRKLAYALAAASMLTFASAANATLTIVGGSPTANNGATIVVQAPNNASIPNSVAFDTFTTLAGLTTSSFDFSESFNAIAQFSVTTSAFGGSITLEQLQPGGGGVAIQTLTGSGSSLTMTTLAQLLAGVNYRFVYAGNMPAGNNDISGNAVFIQAVPEAATWAMMLIGFAGIGLAMRRRIRPAIAQVA
jgi:opacity protein-like surface antigen